MQAHFREQVKDTFEEGIQQTVSKFQEAGIVDSDWTADQLVFRTRGTLQFTETTGLSGGRMQREVSRGQPISREWRARQGSNLRPAA